MSSSSPSDVSNVAETVRENVSETAGSIGDMAKNVASGAAQKAGEAASFVGRKAEDVTSAAGGGMKSLAGTIRENAPHGGILGTAGAAVADTLEQGGRYLETRGLSGLGEDLTTLIRRNPIPAVLLALGLGFFIARARRS